jgi:hypothetical protein
MTTEPKKERKKVLVISRHYPSYSQIRAIQKQCGENCLITWENSRFKDVAEIISWYEQNQYNDIALVAPKDIIASLTAQHIFPIHLLTTEVAEDERQPGDFKKGETLLRAIAQRVKRAEVVITYY